MVTALKLGDLVMRKNNVIGFIVAIIFLLLSTKSFSTPIDLSIISDNNWKTSNTLITDWESTLFNDSAWDSARSPYPAPVLPTDLITDTAAQFIWHDPTATSNGATGSLEAFFRLTINLDIQPDSLPLIGQALISVDDDYDFFVNGSLVFQNHDGGYAHIVDFVDFTSYLQNGINVLAIHAVDGGWSNPWNRSYERMLFDGRISTVSVPEPATYILLGLGLAGLGFQRRKQ